TGPAPTVLAATRDAVVVNSFSKYVSMTGWRLGWMIVPPHLRDAAERLQQNVYICAPHIAQVAGLAAFDAMQELDAHVRRYASNRDLLVDGLAAAGFDRIAAADGAFYVYADASHITADPAVGSASALCRRWLYELGVATTPGLDFDLARGERFVRFSYAGPTADIIESCALLAEWQP
ncbi:MAG: aminotransferase class I/II-fold pyridoxal phosphate-dependent enzyme, partial [Ilumatobacteraceae bacterium]